MRRATPLLRAGERGYTLVELLVVLAVISLLIAATPAIISAGRPGTEARAASYALANTLRAARAAAIAADTDRIVLLDLPNRSYITSDGKTRQLPQGVQWEFVRPTAALDDTKAQLRFFPDGTSSGGRIRIIGAGQDRVIVDHGLTGRISIDE